MHGDFSRWTFDPGAGYRSVLLQQGRVLLDADWNEQGQITARHDEVRTFDVVGPAGGPASGAAFAITAADGTPIADVGGGAGTAWADLRLSPGRFYVDGILVEVAGVGEPPTGAELADQPFLRQSGSLPGLAEPTADGRYAVVLSVWDRQVTADEAPELLESALGGPDTTTRAQTVWQAHLELVDPTDSCSTLVGADWLDRTPPTMTASLAEAPPSADPCEISTSAGYRRLENQLYRVQVVSVDPATGAAQYVWSRENGSVVAGLLQIAAPSVPGVDAELHLDREGRDEELSFREGDLVEVTSRDRALHGLPALLGTAGAPEGLVLPVTWMGATGADPGVADVANLGQAPIVRRWEGGPRAANASADDLEDGIRVAFGAGEFRVGDHWLIPARTVRLVYGVSALGGTIEWPTTAAGDPIPQQPLGPHPHVTTLAVVERSGAAAGSWVLVSDCRRLTPALTELVTIDLLGGDGQESLPGSPLDEPVRVAVRNGGLPVAGALVRFSAPDGHLADTGAPTGASPAGLDLATDASGQVEVRWLPAGDGATTQVLTAQRLDDALAPVGAQVRATARLSIASEVAWDPGCEGMAAATTVQEALAQLATTADLRLLGGDGQQVEKLATTVPRRVRVVLDSPCGPLRRTTVFARASRGALVAPAADGDANPGTLTGTGASSSAEATTDDLGVAAFWWQPDVEQQVSDVLDVFTEEIQAAPIRVSAHRRPEGGGGVRPPGVHITELRFNNGEPFENDSDVKVETLAGGFQVFLDGPVLQPTVQGKPVARVLLDLPWPVEGDGDSWFDTPIGRRTVEIEGELNADGPLIVWAPTVRAQDFLVNRLPDALARLGGVESAGARFELDGWAVVAELDPSLHINGHAVAVLGGASSRTLLKLPTDDEVTGGQFIQWFRTGQG